MRQSVVCKTDLMTEINTGFGWNAGRKLTKQWPLKTVRSSNTYIRQSRLQFTLVKQDKEGHFTLMKGEIHQKKIRVINLYAPNVNATNFIKHTLKNWKETNRSVIQAKNQHRNLRINYTINQMELIDVYNIFHPTTAQYTFFSAAHVMFSKADHILGHEASFCKYKKIHCSTFSGS
jgi:hypothetical protein